MNSIGSQVFLSAPPLPSISPAWPMPPPDTDVFIPGISKGGEGISFPASPSGYARIFLPTPKGARFIGDPKVKTIPNFLPPAKNQPPFAGDRPNPGTRLYLASRPGKPLAEDKIAEWMSERFLKLGFVLDADFDAVLVSTMLKLGERFALSRLLQALVVERGLFFVWGFRLPARLERLRKRGVIAETGTALRPVFSVTSPKSARSRYVLNYIIANRRRAEILGLVERPEQKSKPKTDVFDLAQLLGRQNAILSRIEELEQHQNARIRRLAGNIKERTMERRALMPRRLAELESQLRDLEESAKRWESALDMTGEIVPASPKPEAQPKDKDPVVTGADLETHFIAIESLFGKILGSGRPAGNDLEAIENRYLEWLGGATARQSELRETIKTLRRALQETTAFRRPEAGGAPAVEERPEPKTTVQIDWSEFPRLLKPRGALRILMSNGFSVASGGPSSGSHLCFEHPRLDDKIVISVSAKLFTEERIARNVRAALKALSEEGIAVKW